MATPAVPPRIDAHVHFWRYSAEGHPWIGADMPALRQDRNPANLLPALQAAGLDGVVAVQARGSIAETDFLLELARRHGWIRGVVGWADLAGGDLEARLEAWRGTPRLCGLRHQVQDEPDPDAFLASPAVRRGIALLQARGHAYDVLVRSSQMDAAAAFCARHDAHWLVLDHLGKPPLAAMASDAGAHARWRASLDKFRDMAHVACKLSGLVTEADWRRGLQATDRADIIRCLDAALRVFGPRRLMYGSDWPVCLLAGAYGEAHQIVRDWARGSLSADERAALWGGAAAACYGLT